MTEKKSEFAIQAVDTTTIIPWLKQEYNDPEVICVCIDVGQGKETEGLEGACPAIQAPANTSISKTLSTNSSKITYGRL